MHRLLTAQSLEQVASLKSAGAPSKKIHAVIRGWQDGLAGLYGKPPINIKSPWKILKIVEFAPYFLSQLLTNPREYLREKFTLKTRTINE